jgi:hypothetical protein
MLCAKIEEVGVRTFRDDRDIDGGDDIPDAVRAAIEASDEMVVLLTPQFDDYLTELGKRLKARN